MWTGIEQGLRLVHPLVGTGVGAVAPMVDELGWIVVASVLAGTLAGGWVSGAALVSKGVSRSAAHTGSSPPGALCSMSHLVLPAVPKGDAVPDLRLGPLLRYVDDDRVTVWVETDGPCEVAIAGQRQRTFAVEGHHYAILTVGGRTGQPYEVELDGEKVWPPAGSAFPASRLGIVRGQRTRLVFGSCRTILGDDEDSSDPDTVDALREYAERLAAGGGEGLADPPDLPDLLVFLGDQVYDRQGAPATRAFIRSRRHTDGQPEARDFEEYARLYWEAWGEPAVRWLLSTVPSIMIFDDHDIVDNWNTSEAWVEEMRRTPGWRERITSGLMAYWLYQHVGNLDPDALADDALLRALRDPGDEGRSLREFAAASDAGTYGTPGAQWSFARDLGDIRVAMVDSRNGRCLAAGQREMLDEDEWAWLEEQARGDVRHLLIGTSVPFLLPRGLHSYESFVDAVCEGAWGRWFVPAGERLRRDLQFNKWAAFPSSFSRLRRLVQEVATREHAPQSVLVLSGDVHYSYIARLAGQGAPIHQVVSTPLCYDLERSIQGGFRAGMSPLGARLGGRLARLARRPPPEDDWQLTTGPWFRNVIATLEFDGDRATARLERTRVGDPGERLAVVAEQQLAPARPAAAEG
jgi:hypothetical protein